MVTMIMMKAVGIKQLKARLSEYVRLVKSGETVLVTDRDEVVAELRPARRQPVNAEGLDAVLHELSEAGDVCRASVSKGNWTWKVPGQGLPAGTADAVLNDLRRDSSVEH